MPRPRADLCHTFLDDLARVASPVAMASTLPFDRIMLRDGGDTERLDLDDFLAMPVHQRIRMLLGERLVFFSGNEPVDRRRALAALRNVTIAATRPEMN